MFLSQFATQSTMGRVVLCLLMLGLLLPHFAAAQEAKPNIVLIVLDDVGFSDIGAFGGEIATPVLDQMAKNGVRFSNFHVAAACSPTRAMLYTGVDNHLAGVGTLENVIADNQKGKPGFEGYLNNRVVSIGTLLADAGYRTYFSGKWNLGKTSDQTPVSQGFQKSIALMQTGSDNYEAKSYAPIEDVSTWYEGTTKVTLPQDFYSSKYYVDRMIRFLEIDKDETKPFFSVVCLQANHYPHQVQKEYIDHYMGYYDKGWDQVRKERYARQVQMGLVPASLEPRLGPGAVAWDRLREKEKREYAKRMAVYAGMLEAADEHIGRFRDYLKSAGKLDNTVFIIISDNGADPYRLDKIFWFWYMFNYNVGYESLGGKGAFSAYGQDWAQVSNTPLYLFKGNAAEGGIRTPLIVSWPARFKGERITDAFAHVKDIVPSILELAGVNKPATEYRVRKIIQPDGSSFIGHLDGRADRVHALDEPVGYELGGGMAIFKGDLKLVRDTAEPYGDNIWHLYNIRLDPTESKDLKDTMPDAFKAMQADWDNYMAKSGVVLPPQGYRPIKQLLMNNIGDLLKALWPYLLLLLVVVAAVVYGLIRVLKRLRRP